jgi:hypothetical protein
MTRAALRNNAVTTLASNISVTTDTTFTLASGTGGLFPSSGYFYVTLLDALNTPEIIKITSRAGDVLTTGGRGSDGSAARTWTSGTGTRVSMNVVAAMLNELAPLDSPTFTGTVVAPTVTGTTSGNVPLNPTGVSAMLPAIPQASRPASPTAGYIHFNTTAVAFEGYNGASWGSIGGSAGAAGAGLDQVFYENDVTITANYTIGTNAYSAGITFSAASPMVCTLTSHGLQAENIVHFSTTGTLPNISGTPVISADTPYYVLATGLTANTFSISATRNGTALTSVSATQSGVHSVGRIKNAHSAGPVAIATGITVTVPTGSVWSIS